MLSRLIAWAMAAGMLVAAPVSMAFGQVPEWRETATPAPQSPPAQKMPANAMPAKTIPDETNTQVYDYTDRAPTKDEVRAALYGQPGRLPMSRAIKIGAPPVGGQGHSSPPASGGAVGIAIKVEFEFDSAAILPKYARNMDSFGEVLADDQSLSIKIVGHADATGDAIYNQRLSEKRAASVKQYLTQLYQVDPSRISVAGYGESRPAFNPPTNPKNRRVEFFRR